MLKQIVGDKVAKIQMQSPYRVHAVFLQRRIAGK